MSPNSAGVPPLQSLAQNRIFCLFGILVFASLLSARGLLVLLGPTLVASLWFLLPLILTYRHPFAGLIGSLAAVIIIPHGMVGQIEWEARIHGVPLHPIDLAYIGTMIGWLAGGGLRWLTEDVARKSDYRTTRLLLLGFIFSLVTWSGIGLLRDESLWNIIRDARNLSYYAFGWFAVHQLRSVEQRECILDLFITASAIFAVHCLSVALSPIDATIKSTTLDYWDGISRIYYHNHHLLLLTIPLILWRMLQAESAKNQALLGLLLLLEWTALCLSLTRSMLLVTTLSSLAVGVFAGVYASGQHWARLLRPAITALLTIVLGLSAGSFVASDLSPSLRTVSVFERASSLGPKDSSVRGRLAAYEMAIQDFSSHPIVGHGLGAQMRIPWAHTRRHNVREANRHPAVDSTLLTLMFKLGSIGLLAVLGLGLWYLKKLNQLRINLTTRADRVQALCLVTGAIGVLAVSLVQANLIASRFVLVFVLWCTILLTYRPTETELS